MSGFEFAPTIPIVSSLPTTASDGAEVYYIADQPHDTIWRLRYNTSAPGVHKWEFVGGTPLTLFEPTYTESLTYSGPTSTVTWQSTSNLTLPFPGNYAVTMATAFDLNITLVSTFNFAYVTAGVSWCPPTSTSFTLASVLETGFVGGAPGVYPFAMPTFANAVLSVPSSSFTSFTYTATYSVSMFAYEANSISIVANAAALDTGGIGVPVLTATPIAVG